MSLPTRDSPENVRPLHPSTGGLAVERVDPLAAAWTADRLMAATFPEPRWAVPGLLPEGVSLLAGPPKVGKSWLSLGLGLGIAAGWTVLGEITVQAGPVLYLALEDTPRRLQRRMRQLLVDQLAPAGLTLLTSCPTLPDGGDAVIARWLTRHPDARMVVLDVFARMRGPAPIGLSAYDADYAAVTRAKTIADQFGVAVVLVHHVRKAEAGDFLAEVSGTNGLAGAADTILVLKRGRGQADAILHITGRDVDETERAMTFDPDTGTWTLLAGEPIDHTLHDTRAAILAHVRVHPGVRPKDVAEATGVSHDLARRTCARMADDGQLTKTSTGQYYPVEPVGQTDTGGTVPPVPLSQHDP